MVNTKNNSSEDINFKLRRLKGKTKSKIYKRISNYRDEMNFRRQSGNFQLEEDPFSKDVQGIGKFYHEVLLLGKFLQTKPEVISTNFKYYDLYYTVFKNRNETEVVVDEDKGNDYNNFKDSITPNHYIGRKNNEKTLR